MKYNNNYILNDAVCRQNGKAPIYFVPPASNVYIENIVLNREARNNTYGTKAQIKYFLTAHAAVKKQVKHKIIAESVKST